MFEEWEFHGWVCGLGWFLVHADKSFRLEVGQAAGEGSVETVLRFRRVFEVSNFE